jgi:hypothetical protein
MLTPIFISWASSAPLKAYYCGGAIRIIFSLFNRLFYGIASKIYRLWVPVAEVVVVIITIKIGFTLINNSLINTKLSSSSLEIISGEVLLKKSDFLT